MLLASSGPPLSSKVSGLILWWPFWNSDILSTLSDVDSHSCGVFLHSNTVLISGSLSEHWPVSGPEAVLCKDSSSRPLWFLSGPVKGVSAPNCRLKLFLLKTFSLRCVRSCQNVGRFSSVSVFMVVYTCLSSYFPFLQSLHAGGIGATQSLNNNSTMLQSICTLTTVYQVEPLRGDVKVYASWFEIARTLALVWINVQIQLLSGSVVTFCNLINRIQYGAQEARCWLLATVFINCTSCHCKTQI